VGFNKEHQRREITGKWFGGESHYAWDKRPQEPKELIKAQVIFHIYLHAQGHTHKAEWSRALCITNGISQKGLFLSYAMSGSLTQPAGREELLKALVIL